jgi:hypothetical protein
VLRAVVRETNGRAEMWLLPDRAALVKRMGWEAR